MEKYSPRERIEMIIAGEKPDRYAASFWRHFFHLENSAQGTADAMLYFQKEFKWDFMKINPRADFHIEDYGFTHIFSKDEFTKHTKTHFPISTIDDWKKIEEIDIRSKALDEHLQMVSLIRKGSDKELPILMTIFSPVAIAGRMVSDRSIMAEHIKTNPDVVFEAVEKIARTYEKYTAELRNAGADGIFYATTQWATTNLITWEEYQKFGLPFDLRMLEAAGSDAINVFHICSSDNYLQKIMEHDFNAQIINWETDDPTNMPFDIGLETYPNKVILGGVDHNGWLLHSPPDEVGYKIDEFKEKSDSSRCIIGPGCAVEPKVSFENYRAIRNNL